MDLDRSFHPELEHDLIALSHDPSSLVVVFWLIIHN